MVKIKKTHKPKTPKKTKASFIDSIRHKGLNYRQMMFCAEFAVDLNGTQAAIRAGYAKDTADIHATRLLRIDSVKREISERLMRKIRRTEINADIVLSDLLESARLDISAAYDQNGNLKPIHEIPEEIRREIVSIETEEEFAKVKDLAGNTNNEVVGWTKKVKFSDKMRAREILAKHLGIYKDFADNIPPPVTLHFNVKQDEVKKFADALNSEIAGG